MTFKLYSLIFILSLMGCKTTKVQDTKKEDPISITFGSGGGFTGAIKSYTLKKNGSIYMDYKKNKSEPPILAIDIDKCDQIFDIYESMNFSNYQVDLPGNYFYFIEYKSLGLEHKMTWSSEKEISKELSIYFKILNQLIKN